MTFPGKLANNSFDWYIHHAICMGIAHFGAENDSGFAKGGSSSYSTSLLYQNIDMYAWKWGCVANMGLLLTVFLPFQLFFLIKIVNIVLYFAFLIFNHLFLPNVYNILGKL